MYVFSDPLTYLLWLLFLLQLNARRWMHYAPLFFILLAVHFGPDSLSQWLRDSSPVPIYLEMYLLLPHLHNMLGLGRARLHADILLRADRFLFTFGGALPLPHVWVSSRPTILLDILSSIAYLMFYVSPFVVSAVYSVIDRDSVRPFQMAIMSTSFAMLVIQHLFPTGPPWFIEGLDNIAGLARLDKWLGVPLARNLFGNNAVKFGAFPSIHCLWAYIHALFCGRHLGIWGKALGICYSVWISWATLYLHHHYLVDAAGAFLTLCVYLAIAGWPVPSNLSLPEWLPLPLPDGWGGDWGWRLLP